MHHRKTPWWCFSCQWRHGLLWCLGGWWWHSLLPTRSRASPTRGVGNCCTYWLLRLPGYPTDKSPTRRTLPLWERDWNSAGHGWHSAELEVGRRRLSSDASITPDVPDIDGRRWGRHPPTRSQPGPSQNSFSVDCGQPIMVIAVWHCLCFRGQPWAIRNQSSWVLAVFSTMDQRQMWSRWTLPRENNCYPYSHQFWHRLASGPLHLGWRCCPWGSVPSFPYCKLCTYGLRLRTHLALWNSRTGQSHDR